MKVLFMTRIKKNWIGGDFVQLEQTADALRKLGVEVDVVEFDMDFFKTMTDKLATCDIVHLWNFSMYWTKIQLWAARKAGKPVVCSMIYHESDAFVPYNLQQIMLDNLSCAIFQTKGEKARVDRHLKLRNDIVSIIPNGIDEWWFEKATKKTKNEDFVLTVGRIEPCKNQVNTAKACKRLGIPYYCIGEIRNEEYAKEAEENGATLLGKMDREELKPWYWSAKVVVQASQAETWCLAIDEAVSQGTPVVLTTMCEREDMPITRCNPDDIDDIMNAIQIEWKNKDYSKIKYLKTWNEIGRTIKKIYDKII